MSEIRGEISRRRSVQRAVLQDTQNDRGTADCYGCRGKQSAQRTCEDLSEVENFTQSHWEGPV